MFTWLCLLGSVFFLGNFLKANAAEFLFHMFAFGEEKDTLCAQPRLGIFLVYSSLLGKSQP